MAAPQPGRNPEGPFARFVIVTGLWLVFSVAGGLLGLGIRASQDPIGPTSTDAIDRVLNNGELFIVSTVLASEALGRLGRSFFLHIRCHEPAPLVWWSYSGFITSMSCFIATAVLYANALAFRGMLNTEVSTVVPDSKVMFVATVSGALAVLIATHMNKSRK